jgi:hypothetical protein
MVQGVPFDGTSQPTRVTGAHLFIRKVRRQLQLLSDVLQLLMLLSS